MEQDISERDELAAYTLDRLREALSGSESASVAQIIEIIRKMSNKADVLSIQDLAEAIGYDLTTMVKVMKAANCLQFNPSALEIGTVARAISVIGFDKIQNLALSLMLLEGAENRVNSAECRDVSARALCSALMAEEVIRTLSLADPEAAFVCAALQGYGRLLLSTFLVDEYRHAVRLTEQMLADRAFRLTFGLTPLEVSQRILGEVNLSGIGSAMFQPVSPGLLRNKHPGAAEALLLAADFSASFSDLVSRPELTSMEFERRSEQLLERYSQALSLDRNALKGIVDGVRTRLDKFGRAEGFDGFGSVLMQRIKSIADGVDFVAADVPRHGAGSATVDVQLSPARGPLAAAVKRIKALMAESPVNAIQVFAVASATIRKVLHLESCIVFVRGGHGAQYSACAGDGALFGRIENQPLIDLASRDVFTVCLSQGKDVLIQDPAQPRIAPFVPAWFRDTLNGGSFLLLPVKDDKGVFGVICGVARHEDRIEHGVTNLPLFRSMRNMLNQLGASVALRQAA